MKSKLRDRRRWCSWLTLDSVGICQARAKYNVVHAGCCVGFSCEKHKEPHERIGSVCTPITNRRTKKELGLL